MDRVLRRSLGVSEAAKTDDTVRPAPPAVTDLPEPEPVVPENDGKFGIELPDEMKDKVILFADSKDVWLIHMR